ncbi:hypothetical protein COY95_03600, partial [Candidatus Woesearchaeota archaeon CG_4_10_14_0_8_um_filter_47_5]
FIRMGDSDLELLENQDAEDHAEYYTGTFRTYVASPNNYRQGVIMVFMPDTGLPKDAFPEKGVVVFYITFEEGGEPEKFILTQNYQWVDGKVVLGTVRKVIPVSPDNREGNEEGPHEVYEPPPVVPRDNPFPASAPADSGSGSYTAGYGIIEGSATPPACDGVCNKVGIFTLLQDVKGAGDIGPYNAGKTGAPPVIDEHMGLAAELAGECGWVTQMMFASPGSAETFKSMVWKANGKKLRMIVRLMPDRASGSYTTKDPQAFVKMVQDLGAESVRYVQIFNEPNGNTDEHMSAQEYASFFLAAAKGIKALNPEIKILNAGFNPGTGNTKEYIDAMKANGALEYLDVWASHSYGRTGQREVYSQELGWLGKDVPVLITETGYENPASKGSEMVDDYYTWFKDRRVLGATPFILMDPSGLYWTQYNWVDPGAPGAGQAVTPYPVFEEVKEYRLSQGASQVCG